MRRPRCPRPRRSAGRLHASPRARTRGACRFRHGNGHGDCDRRRVAHPVTSPSNSSVGAAGKRPDSGGGVWRGGLGSSAPKAMSASRSSGWGATGRRDDSRRLLHFFLDGGEELRRRLLRRLSDDRDVRERLERHGLGAHRLRRDEALAALERLGDDDLLGRHADDRFARDLLHVHVDDDLGLGRSLAHAPGEPRASSPRPLRQAAGPSAERLPRRAPWWPRAQVRCEARPRAIGPGRAAPPAGRSSAPCSRAASVQLHERLAPGHPGRDPLAHAARRRARSPRSTRAACSSRDRSAHATRVARTPPRPRRRRAARGASRRAASPRRPRPGRAPSARCSARRRLRWPPRPRAG